jgi:pyruvate, orthophosphate dikinase
LIGRKNAGNVARSSSSSPSSPGSSTPNAGDPASVGFFHAAGVDYVSCSPFRVSVARVAAAQAAIAG